MSCPQVEEMTRAATAASLSADLEGPWVVSTTEIEWQELWHGLGHVPENARFQDQTMEYMEETVAVNALEV